MRIARRIAAGAMMAAFSCAAGAQVFRYDDGYYNHEVEVTNERVVVRERTRSGLRGDLSCPIGPGVSAPTRDDTAAFCVRFAKDRCTYTRYGSKGEAIHEEEWARARGATMDFCVEMGQQDAVRIRGLVNLIPERRTITFPGGHRYEGEFANDTIQGRGVMTWPNGDRYDGQWIAGDRHGRGTMAFANGQRYEGEWREGKMTGRGVLSSPTGERYEGDLVDGARSGRGAARFATGITYDGEWRDDRMTGRGVMTWPNGARYEGDFVDGIRSGRGSMRYGSGAQYEGEWRDDLANGNGIMIWSNGQRYSGQWVNGNRHGRGTHVNRPGEHIVGEWRDDKLLGWGTVVSTEPKPAAERPPMQRQVAPQAMNGTAGDRARVEGEALARIALEAPKQPGAAIPDDAVRHNRSAIEILKSARTPEDNDRAAEALTQALKIAPWVPDLHLYRGLVLEKAGHAEAAVQALQVYLGLDPQVSDRDAVTGRIAALRALVDERKAWLPFTGTWSTGAMTQEVELRGRALTVRVGAPPPGVQYVPGEFLMLGTIQGDRVRGRVYTRPTDPDEIRCFGRDHERDAEGALDGDILRLRWHAFTYNKATCQITASEWKTYQDMRVRPQ